MTATLKSLDQCCAAQRVTLMRHSQVSHLQDRHHQVRAACQ